MIIRNAYVLISLNNNYVPAGRILHERHKGLDSFSFVYARSYLSRSDAFSIDPREMPLSDRVMTFNHLPLAIQDNGPDEFGRYLYSKIHKVAQPDSPLDYHLSNGVDGIGALAISPDLNPQPSSILPKASNLGEIRQAYECLAEGLPIDPRLRELISPGLSLPGARPKTLISGGTGEESWIAKFPRANDIFDIQIAEAAAMIAAQSAGIHCAESRIERVMGSNVYLTRRFDRTEGGPRHFLSAYTLLGANKVNPSTYYQDFSYQALAQLITNISPNPMKDKRELFMRMVFNVLSSNKDDHLKNHGFLYDPKSRRYELSPAYDIVPGAQGYVHAIGISPGGAEGTVSNVLEASPFFGINKAEAISIIQAISRETEKIPDIAKSLGMNSGEAEILRTSMPYADKGVDYAFTL